jgi:hypothetical protein
MKPSLVSVIILNWNGEKYLQSCLRSVLDQTYPKVEILVVDNNSQDGSVALLETKFPQIRLIKSEVNLGFAAGNNLGINQSSGEYVALLNNDTELDSDWLEELIKAAGTQPHIGMCASKIKYLQERDTLNSTGVIIYPDLTAINRGIGEKDTGQYDLHRSVFCPYGAAALYRKDMLNQVGLLDEDYFMFREEDELGWRANLAGWKCIYVPTAVVYHYRSAATKVGSPFKLYYGERNRLYTCFKYLTIPMILQTLPHVFKRYIFSSRGATTEARPGLSKLKLLGTLFRAHLDALKKSGRMRRKGSEFLGRYSQTRNHIREILRAYPASLGDLSGQLRRPSS